MLVYKRIFEKCQIYQISNVINNPVSVVCQPGSSWISPEEVNVHLLSVSYIHLIIDWITVVCQQKKKGKIVGKCLSLIKPKGLDNIKGNLMNSTIDRNCE